MTPPARAFVLRGPDAAAAVDWLHVHGDVLGVLEDGEREVAFTVWLPGPLPELPFAGLAIDELPGDEANRTATGREHDRPIAIAADLLVRPPWVEPPPGFAGIELVVPRGMAFGSGEHDSTRAALRALHAVWTTSATFADVGTGSGILAAYAAARGAARIAACDVDPLAVAAARELVPRATVTLGGPASLPFAADVVVANLTAAELHAALPELLPKWTRRGVLVLSGMRDHEADGVVRAVAAAVPTHVVHRESAGAFRAFAFAGVAPAQADQTR